MRDVASWSALTWCTVTGCSLFFGSFLVVLPYILVKSGKRRKMTHQEIKARILNDDITDMPTYSVAGPGVGVWVEASANIDTMRAHAARGEWGLFWAWPLMVVSMTTGGQLVIVAVSIDAGSPIFALISGVLLVPFAVAWLCIPFIVLYTKRDAVDDDASVDPPESFHRR